VKGASFFRSADFDALSKELVNSLHDSSLTSIYSGASKVLDMHYIMNEVAASSDLNEAAKTSLSGKKSTSLQRFQELVSDYFEENLAGKRSLNSDPLSGLFTKVRANELEQDTSALFRDLPLMAKQEECLHTTTFGDPEASDYTALALTKFLHGVDAPRASIRAFRAHPLFGKWREVQFSSVLESVQRLLDP
jgi:hypothetical protein